MVAALSSKLLNLCEFRWPNTPSIRHLTQGRKAPLKHKEQLSLCYDHILGFKVNTQLQLRKKTGCHSLMLFWEVSALHIKGSDSLAEYKHETLIRVLLPYKFIAVEQQKHIITLRGMRCTASGEVHFQAHIFKLWRQISFSPKERHHDSVI